MNIFNSICFLAIAVVLPSCGLSSQSSASKVETESKTEVEIAEGINIEENPLGALQKIIELSKNATLADDGKNEETEAKPISFKELLGYLPQPPLGWKADKPEGETNSFSSYSISQVRQNFTNGDKQIEVSIFDWAFNSALYTPFLLSTEFSQESTEGYNKGIKIGDIPGREEYSYSSEKGSLNLLVDSRFLIQIDGENIQDSELREWWGRIDRQSLGKIANK